MRRPLRTALALGVLAGAGAASAATVQGTAGADRLLGTGQADALSGFAGDDFLDGRGGRDLLRGGAGNDRLAAALDGARDDVRCGPGLDVAVAELADRVAADCEVVSRQLSRDPYFERDGQHQTQVEPDSFAFGSTLVAAFQVGRSQAGGAVNIGWASSSDAGTTWRSGLLERVRGHVSDPVVAYDAAHRTWLIGILGVSGETTDLLVSRSPDAQTWSAPEPVASDPAEEPDKEWLACDNWPGSPLRGRCYLVYVDFAAMELRTRWSGDGGRTWSAPAAARTDVRSLGILNGVQPVVRPDGTLVVVYAVFGAFADPAANHIGAVASADGGVSFAAPVRIADLFEEQIFAMRAPPLPSVEIAGDGRIYAAWHDCRHREACAANDVVLTSTRDGVSWSVPTRVPIGDPRARVDYFLPGLGVDPAPGSRRIAVVLHSLRRFAGCFDGCPNGIDVWLLTSGDGGTTWSRPQRLNSQAMPLEWIADTNLGRMLGDYVSTSWTAGRPVPVFSLSGPPVRGELRQAIFATTRPGSARR